MEIFLNGRPDLSSSGDTLLQALERRGLEPGEVVVEINGEIIPRERFGLTAFKPGDKVEILHFVGGG
jgi:thiamine biosynthesis protein ThiS